MKELRERRSEVGNVANTVGELQNKFKWLNSSFLELVKGEAYEKLVS